MRPANKLRPSAHYITLDNNINFQSDESLTKKSRKCKCKTLCYEYIQEKEAHIMEFLKVKNLHSLYGRNERQVRHS